MNVSEIRNYSTHTLNNKKAYEISEPISGKAGYDKHTLRKREEWPDNQLKNIQTANTSEVKSHRVTH